MPDLSPENTLCMHGCQRSITTRGVCNTCYQAAYRLVQKGKYTYQELQKIGMLLPTAWETGARLGATNFAQKLHKKLNPDD